MALFTLQAALANYRKDRARLKGAVYPAVGCPCPMCDIVRAADLLYEAARGEMLDRHAPKPLPPGPGGRLTN